MLSATPMYNHSWYKHCIREKLVKVARRLLSLGVDVNTVIQATELTKEEINHLQD